MRVCAVQVNPIIGDLEGNTQKILRGLQAARAGGAEVVLFSELVVTGYSPEDLLLDRKFIDEAGRCLKVIAKETKGLFAVVGIPRRNPTKKGKPLYNSAAVFANGKLLGFKDKELLPTYDVFDERRHFEPGTSKGTVWRYKGKKIAVTVCEDAWQHAGLLGYTNYAVDPVLRLKKLDLVLNLSASPYYIKRKDTRMATFRSVAKFAKCPLLFCNQVGANDQLIFGGGSFCLNKRGELVAEGPSFAEGEMFVDLPGKKIAVKCNEIADLHAALVLGVRDYFHKQGFRRAILGLSGGIDSALTASLAVAALGAENVEAFFLPTRYTSSASKDDAAAVARNLNIRLTTIDIDSMFQRYLELFHPFFGDRPHDLAEQNVQSRIRATILMAFSNKFGALLLSTGNKTEIAMGYTTLYGDMAGGLAVLHDVTKTYVYKLARFVKNIPESILKRVPSAELKHNQKTYEELFPFQMLDAVLEAYIEERKTLEEIAKAQKLPLPVVKEIVQRIHSAEYKRRQAPISLRVTSKAFSKGRNIPIVMNKDFR